MLLTCTMIVCFKEQNLSGRRWQECSPGKLNPSLLPDRMVKHLSQHPVHSHGCKNTVIFAQQSVFPKQPTLKRRSHQKKKPESKQILQVEASRASVTVALHKVKGWVRPIFTRSLLSVFRSSEQRRKKASH